MANKKKLKSTGKLERLLCCKEHHPMFLDCIQAIFSALTTNFFALHPVFVRLFLCSAHFCLFSRSLLLPLARSFVSFAIFLFSSLFLAALFLCLRCLTSYHSREFLIGFAVPLVFILFIGCIDGDMICQSAGCTKSFRFAEENYSKKHKRFLCSKCMKTS